MRDSFKLEFFNSLFDAGNQYSTSPAAGAAEAFFHGTMYTGAFEPPPPPPLFMPPPPPPPPPPQVAHDDCAKKSTRRATAIERKSCVFMVRDYSRGATRLAAFKCSSAEKIAVVILTRFQPGDYVIPIVSLNRFNGFSLKSWMETVETVVRSIMVHLSTRLKPAVNEKDCIRN